MNSPPIRTVEEQNEVEQAHYDRFWRTSPKDRSYSSSFRYHYTSTSPTEEIARLIDASKHHHEASMLDIGCGVGRNALYYASKGYRVTGIDISGECIRKCLNENTTLQAKGNLRFFNLSILDIPSSLGRFDIIIDDGCFHHIVPSLWGTYVQRIRQLCQVNSLFIIAGFSDQSQQWKSFQQQSRERNWVLEESGHYTHFLSTRDVEWLCTQFGPTLDQITFKQNENVIWRICSFSPNQ